MINWKKWFKNIPGRLLTASGVYYEILQKKKFYSKEPRDGETDYAYKQIIIQEGLGKKTTIITLYHEFWHALSNEHDIRLTERQVEQIEKTLPYVTRFIKELDE